MRKSKAVFVSLLALMLLLAGCMNGAHMQPAVSQRMNDAVRENWDDWNAMPLESQVLSSAMPGNCEQKFDDWRACEEYMELAVDNPLEACDWLEKGTYVAMPIGFADVPRIVLNWYGEEDGTIEKVSITAGYRYDNIRVMLQTDVYGEVVVVAAESDLAASSEEKYFSMRCHIVEDNVLYQLNVVGSPDAKSQVEEVFAKVLTLFPE